MVESQPESIYIAGRDFLERLSSIIASKSSGGKLLDAYQTHFLMVDNHAASHFRARLERRDGGSPAAGVRPLRLGSAHRHWPRGAAAVCRRAGVPAVEALAP